MKKINAIPGSIKWSRSVYNPELVIYFRRSEKSNEWYEIRIKLTPDVVRDISLNLKKYIADWWKSQQDTLNEIREHLKF